MAAERQNGGSSTAVLEPIELQPVQLKDNLPTISTKRTSSVAGRSLGSANSKTEDDDADRNETLPSPTTAQMEVPEAWNKPRINMYRVGATFWSFAVMGMNDAAYGALIPYLETYYNLNYTIVALVFLSPFVGYNLAALSNNVVHLKFGQRGVAILGPTCHLIAYIINACHPPYPVLVISFMLAGLGNGIEDAAWNAWIGAMSNPNEVLGFLHGLYGVGGTIAPLVATTLITKANVPWYYWYYCMIGAAAVELAVSAHAFWGCTGAVFRAANARTSGNGSRLKEAILQKPAARVTWLAALFLLGYVGIEVGLGGWIVVFMIRVRDGERFASGMTATGFWLGLTLGRIVLGFVTPKIGEKLAIAVCTTISSPYVFTNDQLQIYLPIAMGLELLFWLVPQFYVSAISVGLIGFFIGPLFPAAMVACTKLLPKHLHVSSIGFAAAFGGSGGAIFPYIIGVIAQAKGVKTLQPIILSLLGVILALWLCLPRINKKKE